MVRILLWIVLLTVLATELSIAAEPPARILDLANWKLTLPTDTKQRGRADEVGQPELATFEDFQFFHISKSAKGVVLRAPCGGVTTKGSKYPRCELREMKAGGRDEAEWSTDDSTVHVMTLSLAVTATPPKKKHVVIAQIHDARDDLLMVRLEGNKLLVERESHDDVILNSRYELGERVELRLEAGVGHVRLWYNGKPSLDWPVSRTGCYFKAGCYTQSNLGQGDNPESFGEVILYQVGVEQRN